MSSTKFSVGDIVVDTDNEMAVVAASDPAFDEEANIKEYHVRLKYCNVGGRFYHSGFLYKWRHHSDLRKLTKLEKALR
jgi:hypothetical protein